MDAIKMRAAIEQHKLWLETEGREGKRLELFASDLRLAVFQEANLRKATLLDCDLRGANLSYADLRDADLRRANLSMANLSEADLSGANLVGANLGFANLNGVHISAETKF